jgi:hypothetical protein
MHGLIQMLEKFIIGLGCIVGIIAGFSFYLVADQLRLPALLFFIVDIFGVIPGSLFVGLFSAPVAIGTMTLGTEMIFPQQRKSQNC